MSAIRSTFVVLATALVLSGCSHKLKSSSGAKPTVTNQDLTYCNSDQTFVVTGTGLSPMIVKGATDKPDLEMPTVCLKPAADPTGTEATPTLDNCPTKEACGCRIKNEDVSWASQKEVRFTLHPTYGLQKGWYDVVIKNPDGTQASGNVRVHVLPGEMIVVFTDPSIVYNGFAIEPTIFGSNLVDVTKVSIRDSNFVETALTDVQSNVGGHNSQVQATLGANQATGTYDVVVEASNGCKAELAQGLQVTSTLEATLVSAIDPTFGWNQENTSVTITGAGFAAIPRVYVSPVNASAGSVASPLRSVAMKSDTTLTAVVPRDLPPGPYNVIVVNPDGKVGVLSNLPGATGDQGGFFVTADPPPVVDSISPLYVTNQAPVTVTIDGTGFNNPTVTLTCQGPTGTTSSPPATVAANPTATTFNATFDTTTLDGGTVCLVTVTNPDNAYFVFSAVGVSIPSANLNPMVAATDLSEARRAPAVAAGRATRSARFVYAIGGDDGTAGGAKNSVETTAMDVYGVPGTWFNQPVTLPGVRTLSAVTRIGNFLYLVGGNDGTAAIASVLRAEVLQAANAPKIVDVGARRPPKNPPDNLGPGVGPGIWYYRVSAVMGATDASNPGGETLASDPFVVDLRQRDPTDTIRITLYWDAVPGAASYRVYRNITGGPEENVDSVRLLKADIAAADLQYEDTAATPPGGDSPRPLGATGNWANLPAMNVAREALGVAAGRDPQDTSGNSWYLYALGGRSGGAAVASTERLPVTIATDATTLIQSQNVGTWTAGANLSAPRSELTGFSVTHVEAIAVPVGTTYIYAGGGVGSPNVDAAAIAAGGDLAWQTVKAMSPQRQGYAGVAGASFLFVFGGSQTDGSDDSMAAAELSTPPDFVNWNNNGGARLVHPRYYAGSTVESAFIYLVGGISNGAVTNTTERTVL